jgi:hypothetical protein
LEKELQKVIDENIPRLKNVKKEAEKRVQNS